MRELSPRMSLSWLCPGAVSEHWSSLSRYFILCLRGLGGLCGKWFFGEEMTGNRRQRWYFMHRKFSKVKASGKAEWLWKRQRHLSYCRWDSGLSLAPPLARLEPLADDAIFRRLWADQRGAPASHVLAEVKRLQMARLGTQGMNDLFPTVASWEGGWEWLLGTQS